MDNTTLLIQNPINFQFLSVCHYITSFGLFFYNQKLIPLENRNHSVSVLNTFFEYIHNSENETETKVRLLQRVLRGTDLYGGGENETLDTKYVDDTYHYIISTALFSHYGNIEGYLAGIINRAQSLNYLALKEMVLLQLSKNYQGRDYCSSRVERISLTLSTIQNIFKNNIWSMFPEPEENIEIVNVNYLYAMTGLKIARCIQLDISNMTFESYILLSRGFDLQTFDNETHALVMELFKTPALFYSAYKERDNFRKQNTSQLIVSNDFWQNAYKILFVHINFSLNEILNQSIVQSLHHKLEVRLKQLKSRTFFSYEILRLVCDYSHIGEVSSVYAYLYKTAQWLLKLVLQKRCKETALPDLEEIYNDQFIYVQETYHEIERNSLERVLLEGGIIEKMNSNATVQFAKLPNHPMYCMYCPPMSRKKNQDIYLLFAIVENRKTDYYAIRQEEHTLTLLKSNGNEQEFSRIVANDSSLTMELPLITNFLKKRGEDYKAFIQRVADIKTNEYIQSLKQHYRDPTGAEKVLDFLKSLVPFYTCIQNINSGNKGLAAFTCSLDVLSLLPVAGVGAKYSSIMWNSLVSSIGKETLVSLSTSVFNRLTLTTALNQMYKTVIRTLSAEILSRHFLKDLTIASLRTLDPGFELSFQFLKFSKNMLGKLVYTLSTKLKNIPKVEHLLHSIKSTKNFANNAKIVVDQTGLMPSVISQKSNYEFVRYQYPGGLNYFGPKCVSSFGKTAELRTVEGNLFQLPVMPVKSSENSISYRLYDPTTGDIFKTNFIMGDDGILRRGNNYNILTQGDRELATLRPYGEYDSELEWMKALCKRRRFARTGRTNLKEIIDLEVERCILPLPLDLSLPRNSPPNLNDNIPGTSRGSLNTQIIRNTIHPTDVQKSITLLDKFKEKGLAGLKEDKSLLEFRKLIDFMDSYQTTQKLSKEKVNLWFTEILTRPSIVNDLKNLKGTDFYFNDLTLLSSVDPGDVIPLKRAKLSLKTEVRYHLEFDSHLGLVDLSALHNKYKNEFLVFPEVEFFVKDTEYINGKEILVLSLQQKAMSKDDWLKIRIGGNLQLHSSEVVQYSKRAETIEDAALFVSRSTPLHKFTEVEDILKKYILRVDSVESAVPTYNELAREIYAGSIAGKNTIPLKYSEWKIVNYKYIDDILFHKKLYQINDVKVAKSTIDNVYNGIYQQWVEPVFDNYHRSAAIRNSLRFEDYYAIYSYLFHNSMSDVESSRRIAVALRRLALRQCGEKSITEPFSIFYSANLPGDEFQRLIRMKTGDDFGLTKTQKFHSNKNFVLNYREPSDPSETLVLYELKVTNKAGIVDINSIMTDPFVHYMVLEESKLTLGVREKRIINGMDVFTVTLHNERLPTEERMVRLINRLNLLLRRNTKYYIDL